MHLIDGWENEPCEKSFNVDTQFLYFYSHSFILIIIIPQVENGAECSFWTCTYTWIPVTACSCFWQHSLLFALPVIQNRCRLHFFCHCPVASFVFTNWTGGRCVDARSTCGRSFSEEEGKSQHLGPFWKCNLRLNSSLAEGKYTLITDTLVLMGDNSCQVPDPIGSVWVAPLL